MKIRQLWWLLPLFAVAGYMACRKVDSRHTEEPQQTVKENRFFNEHLSTDPQVIALTDYIKRQNEKLKFVDKTVSQIGYPRWDKAFAITKGKNAGKGQSDSSVSVTYIPFVRDTQNYVNASLAIYTSPSDTSFSYLCDWQYSQMPHGLPAVDTSAEKYTLFFMSMNNKVFGYTKFKLLDEELFPTLPNSDSTRTISIISNNNRNISGKPSVLVTTVECLQFSYCTTPNSIACSGPGGCDYLNCHGNNGECGIFEICWEYTYDTGGGGGGTSGGTGGTGTGGEFGIGGGGSGTPPPPPCGNPVVARPAINEGCTPGFVPILPIEPDEPVVYYPSFLWSYLTKPCLKTALSKLSGGTTNTFFRQIYNTFDTSMSVHMSFHEADLLSSNAYGTATPTTIPSGPLVIVNIDTTDLLNCSQEWMAYVMIHEIAHAAMMTKGILFDTTNTDHIRMIGEFLTRMANSLKAAYPNLPLLDAYAMCFAGFYNGVEGSPTAEEMSATHLILKEINQKFVTNFSIDSLANWGRDYTETGTKGTRNSCN